MKKIILIITVCTFFAAVSCDVDELPPYLSNPEFGTDENKGFIEQLYSSDCEALLAVHGYGNNMYSIYGRITSSSIREVDDNAVIIRVVDPFLLDAGPIIIADVEIEANNEKEYEAVFFNSGPGTFPEFGANHRWYVTENKKYDIPELDTQIYVPSYLKIEHPLNDGNAISFDNGLTIRWNPDKNNDSILIELTYDNDSHEAMPGFDIFWERFVEDDGDFTIPPEILGWMPQKGSFDLTITRFNSLIVEIRDYRYLLIVHMSDRDFFKIDTD